MEFVPSLPIVLGDGASSTFTTLFCLGFLLMVLWPGIKGRLKLKNQRRAI
jgi:hypothetical protein